MMLNKNLAVRIFMFSLVLGMNCLVLFAASKKSAKGSSNGVSIPVPENTKKSQEYFSSIAPRIMNLIQDGSPRSLKLAASLLHRNNEANYSEKEKVLLSLCQSITQIAWPSQNVSWEVPDFSRSDAYTNSVYSAKNGSFEIKVKNEDFLSLVLPSLVIVTNSSDEYFEKVEKSLSKALAMQEKSTLANYLMGILKYRKAEYEESFSYFSKALASDSSNKEILSYGIKVCNLGGDYKNSLSLGEQLVALDPQDIDALKLVCDAYYSMGDLEKAGNYAARILMLSPESFDYVLMRAKIAMANEDYVKTSSLLDAYSRSGNVSKDYYLLRAKLQKEWNKNNNSAAETVGKALLDYPEDADIMLYAATIASEANMKIAGYSALELAKKVLKINANSRKAVKICVSELSKSGEYGKAYELSSNIVQKSSATTDDLCNHVEICLSFNKNEEAEKMIKRLYAKESQNETVQKAYVKVLVANENTSGAEKMINALMANANSEMKSFLLYEKSFLYGDEASTLESLRASLTQNPRNSDSLYRLYQVYYNKKDWRRAQYYLRQVVALNPIDANALAKNEELNALLKR